MNGSVKVIRITCTKQIISELAKQRLSKKPVTTYEQLTEDLILEIYNNHVKKVECVGIDEKDRFVIIIEDGRVKTGERRLRAVNNIAQDSELWGVFYASYYSEPEDGEMVFDAKIDIGWRVMWWLKLPENKVLVDRLITNGVCYDNQ